MKTVTQHWLMQRLSAIALIPLTYWIFNFLYQCLHANYTEITLWIGTAPNRVALIAWFLVVCYHSALGLQVVIEDYIANSHKQSFAIRLTHVFFSGIALCSTILAIAL